MLPSSFIPHCMKYLRSLKANIVFPVFALCLLAGLALFAQQTPSSPSSTGSGSGSGSGSGQNSQQTPEAGGPQGDMGTIVVPKKKPSTEATPLPERAPRVQNPEGLENYSIRVDVPIVNIPVQVISKDGMFIPGLRKDNFKVFEDGVPQKLLSGQQTEAPITAVMVVEFASTNYAFMYDALNASYTFASTLKPEDWIAVEYYSMRPHLLVDFTQDKRAVQGAINTLRIPDFSETNLFDALYDVIDRLETVEGRKYVILISSGYDSFSRLTFDKVLKKVQGSRDISIFAISTGQAFRIMADARMADTARLDFLQADNQMRTFAHLTGGEAYFPRFTQDMPDIFRSISAAIRSQYILSYKPTNPKQDGSFRKIKVELVNDKGEPLIIQDQKHKNVKYNVIAREGYRAKQEVE